MILLLGLIGLLMGIHCYTSIKGVSCKEEVVLIGISMFNILGGIIFILIGIFREIL